MQPFIRSRLRASPAAPGWEGRADRGGRGGGCNPSPSSPPARPSSPPLTSAGPSPGNGGGASLPEPRQAGRRSAPAGSWRRSRSTLSESRPRPRPAGGTLAVGERAGEGGGSGVSEGIAVRAGGGEPGDPRAPPGPCLEGGAGVGRRPARPLGQLGTFRVPDLSRRPRKSRPRPGGDAGLFFWRPPPHSFPGSRFFLGPRGEDGTAPPPKLEPPPRLNPPPQLSADWLDSRCRPPLSILAPLSSASSSARCFDPPTPPRSKPPRPARPPMS